MSNVPNPANPPKSFDEVVKSMQMSPQEQADLEAEAYANAEEAEDGPKEEAKAGTVIPEVDPKDPNAIPDWVVLPPDLKVPPGKQLAFLLFRAKWTDKPSKGDRQVILWPLSDADEKLALKRTRGEAMRTLGELSKQMIRAIDGVKADWTGNASTGNVERLWDELGSKCRGLIQNYYAKTHQLAEEDKQDFFLNCLVVRNSVAG